MTGYKLRQITLEDKKRPMSADDFAEIELAIRSMRCNPDPEGYADFVVVSFKTEINGLLFIQSLSMESYKKCFVEVAFSRGGKYFPRLLAKYDLPVEETVKLFRDVCCSEKNPDFSEWKDNTENIQEVIEERERKKGKDK